MGMFWVFAARLIAFLFDLLTMRRNFERAKDLEVLLLRQQVRILQSRLDRPPRLTRA